MSAPVITNGDPIIYGTLGTALGSEEKPELDYEVDVSDGIRKVTAVLTRRIHCLDANVEAVKQAASFASAVVTHGSTSYGAGWMVNDLHVGGDGDAGSIVTVRLKREGVTPFEIELPPGLRTVNLNGVSSLILTNAAGHDVLLMRWNSNTGQDRYGWRVEYVPTGGLRFGSWYAPFVAHAYSVRVLYENVEQFKYAYSAEVSYKSEAQTQKFVGFSTRAEAQQSADRLAAIYIETLNRRIKRRSTSIQQWNWSGARLTSDGRGTLLSIDENTLTYSIEASGSGWALTISVDGMVGSAEVDQAAVWANQMKGLHWEAVTDNDSGSSTYGHLFYRMVVCGMMLFAIDVTAAGGVA